MRTRSACQEPEALRLSVEDFVLGPSSDLEVLAEQMAQQLL